MRLRPVTVIALATLLAIAAVTSEAWARAGSGGSRGSRSYSSPSRPAPTSPGAPVSPARPATPAPSAPRPSPFGGFMGALGGFMLGGLLGSLLFGGLLGGGLGGGIGLLDILLVAGGVFLLFKFLQTRRQQPQPAYAGAPGWGGGAAPVPVQAATAVAEPLGAEADLDRGLAHIRQMDQTFDAAALAAEAAEVFRTVQTAVAARDVSPLRSRIAPELFERLEQQCEGLRRGGQVNRLERIQIDRAEVTEAWQERGQDYVTVVLAGSLLDYVVDGAGRIVAGSPTAPERFEEFWTFTRSVGRQPWRLTAIQTG